MSTALSALEANDEWMVLDLVQKRVLTDPEMMLIGRDQAYDMRGESDEGASCPLFIHLPPWWELLEQAPVSAVSAPRTTPIDKPDVDREVLYGDALLNDLAKRILAAVESSLWRTQKAASDQRARYPFTVAVHRQWLMTGRPDLDGRKPRQLLHGAVDWIDRIIEGQQYRFGYIEQMIAIPDSVVGFDTAPMGREEMVLYFDLCRELIEAGWMWCIAQGGQQAQTGQELPRSELVAVFCARSKRLGCRARMKVARLPVFQSSAAGGTCRRGLVWPSRGWTRQRPQSMCSTAIAPFAL